LLNANFIISHEWERPPVNILTAKLDMLIVQQTTKGMVHPKINSFIIYSPSSWYKFVWISFFCWTQKIF